MEGELISYYKIIVADKWLQNRGTKNVLVYDERKDED
jgi:hypothetical protein